MKVLRDGFRFQPTTILNSISHSDTTIVLGQHTVDSEGGVLVIDRIDNMGNSTPTTREFISYEGIVFYGDKWVLQKVQRGAYGSPALTHASGAIIESVPVYKETNIQTRPERMLENCLRKIL